MRAVQVTFAFDRIERALSMIVTNLSKLSGLAAETERLDALFAGVIEPYGWPDGLHPSAINRTVHQSLQRINNTCMPCPHPSPCTPSKQQR